MHRFLHFSQLRPPGEALGAVVALVLGATHASGWKPLSFDPFGPRENVPKGMGKSQSLGPCRGTCLVIHIVQAEPSLWEVLSASDSAQTSKFASMISPMVDKVSRDLIKVQMASDSIESMIVNDRVV